MSGPETALRVPCKPPPPFPKGYVLLEAEKQNREESGEGAPRGREYLEKDIKEGFLEEVASEC